MKKIIDIKIKHRRYRIYFKLSWANGWSKWRETRTKYKK